MKTFKQYLLEIFNPNKTHELTHPDLVETDEDHVIKYKHTPKDKEGNLINADEIVTSFTHNGNNSWDVMFTRGGYVSRPIKRSTNNVLNPAIKVFDHLNHFVQEHPWTHENRFFCKCCCYQSAVDPADPDFQVFPLLYETHTEDCILCTQTEHRDDSFHL